MVLHNRKIRVDWIPDFFLYFFCGFPFLYLFPLPSDVQPYAMAYAAIYLIIRKRIRIPKLCVRVFWICIFSGALVLVAVPQTDFGRDMLLVFRKWGNYISLFLISTAVYNSLKKTGGGS